ncbi:hypothetical protein COY20_01920 [Candidatus Shapirobacteria bacterium CG_4_10_14_0_2_um_filter_40_12]|uniref:Glycosyl transferase family 28 C-terminal domain-containing protein n=1 Tax=Candidatus Shapirobacteria bacterium CG_4_10_14_0_2_um_filter_40_12 TaxID=1974871 RepID=A0A2M7TTC1_9BACT|nr:MAG: hypothetical protein COY20_01920 [Candidatus Shapirobacteria bacterium CG_4_10_14_0_2_um_filter_40_12]
MHPNKVVIFISNPFGFGPTGKTVALIEELHKSWPGKIVYAASPMCQETLPGHIKEKVLIENIDERNEASLRRVFNKYKNPLIVCTLNRLAIKTAKLMGLRAFFIDSLAWMWKEIPEEYLMADTYYCFNLFDIKERLPKRNNIKVIAPIFGILPEYKTVKEAFVLFHVGGFINPFQDKMLFAYLNLLTDSFKNFEPTKEVVVTGGNDAVSYMESKVKNSNFRFYTLERDEFLKQLNNTSHFITTSGLTATLEAFALRTPTSFIPPTNLSQWNILKLLTRKSCADSKIEWADILSHETDFEGLSEKEAIPKFHQMAEEGYNNVKNHDKFIYNLNNLITSIPSRNKQTEFIESTGTNGSKVIVQDLITNLV